MLTFEERLDLKHSLFIYCITVSICQRTIILFMPPMWLFLFSRLLENAVHFSRNSTKKGLNAPQHR